MLIAMWIALLLCVALLIIGVSTWFMPILFAVKLILSLITIAPAIAFGAIIIEELRNW